MRCDRKSTRAAFSSASAPNRPSRKMIQCGGWPWNWWLLSRPPQTRSAAHSSRLSAPRSRLPGNSDTRPQPTRIETTRPATSTPAARQNAPRRVIA